MMLRNRSRAVGSKQNLMSESTIGSNQAKDKPSIFPSSPRPFMAFSPMNGIFDTEAAMSPTSILDTKHLSSSVLNPFLSDRSLKRPSSEPNSTSGNAGSKPVGLGLVDALGAEEAKPKQSKLASRKLLLGSHLRIQIPGEAPSSPIEFGVKNRDAQLALLSPARRFLPSLGNSGPELAGSPSARIFAGGVSPREMALSEDYTCVISRGPNPRTTHIFDDCIVESCGDEFAVSDKENGVTDDRGVLPPNDFLSFCHACKKNLGHGNDIFIYRGEKAFCSSECRDQEMLFDEAMENLH